MAGSPVDVARAFLAQELSCGEDQIQVVNVEAVMWRDTSLGCSQPGQMYAQVLVPGFRVTLSQGLNEYVVHTDQGNRAVRCANPTPPLPDDLT